MTVQRGSVIAATWLIGLGIVFLVRQAFGLAWSEAWPMFVILAGVAGIVSEAVGGRSPRGIAVLWAYTWPVVTLGVGFVLLLSTTEDLGRGPIELMADVWPWLVVGLGAWFVLGAIIPTNAAPIEDVTVPLAGPSVD